MKIISACVLGAVLLLNKQNIKAEETSAAFAKQSSVDVISMVKSSAVFAEVIMDSPLYSEKEEKGRMIGEIHSGAMVEILQDYSTNWYFVKQNLTADVGWVKAECLKIPPDTKANKELMTEPQLEEYVNKMEFASDTRHLIFTDIDRQQTHVFKGSKGRWKLEKSFLCATGKNESPTTRGTFRTSDRGIWFYTERLGSGAKYWVRFNGAYLFHSVAMDKDKNIIDCVLGEKRSSGCVRLTVDDAKWIYENIPADTTVVIY